MKQAAGKTTRSSDGEPGTLGFGSIALTFLDTTWRIATPVVLFTIAGIWADRHFGTKPWVTFSCVPIGFAAAVLLVKKQLEAVQQLDTQTERKKKS